MKPPGPTQLSCFQFTLKHLSSQALGEDQFCGIESAWICLRLVMYNVRITGDIQLNNQLIL